MTDAERALRDSGARTPQPKDLWDMVMEEARASANIEGEYDEDRIAAHARALGEFLRDPRGEPAMLQLHGRMMDGQAHAQPGRYRTVGVTIGGWKPPGPALVPALMAELFERLAGQPTGVAGAVWAHVEFETVHPFADGNGRTGRALMQAMLGSCLPISPFILRERPTYYELFRRNEWPRWLEWFCRGITEQRDGIMKERRE